MSFNKTFATIAFILALLAAFAGVPHRNDVNIKKIAELVENENDHITPVELAEKIRDGQTIRLIDLRDSLSYVQEHIPNSTLMSIQKLVTGGIKRNEVVVLYSEGGIHASQAWVLLKMQHFDSVYTLLGGFTSWKTEIMYPTLSLPATEEQKKDFEQKKLLSVFFGGEPKILSGEAIKENHPPKKQQQIKQIPKVIFQKEEDKLREGC